MIKIYNSQKGFTLLELLIVFSITAVLSTVGIASFVTYSRQTTLSNTTSDIKNFLYSARSKALNGERDSCSSTDYLVGYEVLFCCSGAGCPTCLGTGNYEMDVLCSSGSGNSSYPIQSKKYPPNVTLFSSTNNSYLFYTLSGGVNNTGTLTYSVFGTQKTISILKNGIIQ